LFAKEEKLTHQKPERKRQDGNLYLNAGERRDERTEKEHYEQIPLKGQGEGSQ